jgi:hypothetical protein
MRALSESTAVPVLPLQRRMGNASRAQIQSPATLRTRLPDPLFTRTTAAGSATNTIIAWAAAARRVPQPHALPASIAELATAQARRTLCVSRARGPRETPLTQMAAEYTPQHFLILQYRAAGSAMQATS